MSFVGREASVLKPGDDTNGPVLMSKPEKEVDFVPNTVNELEKVSDALSDINWYKDVLEKKLDVPASISPYLEDITALGKVGTNTASAYVLLKRLADNASPFFNFVSSIINVDTTAAKAQMQRFYAINFQLSRKNFLKDVQSVHAHLQDICHYVTRGLYECVSKVTQSVILCAELSHLTLERPVASTKYALFMCDALTRSVHRVRRDTKASHDLYIKRQLETFRLLTQEIMQEAPSAEQLRNKLKYPHPYVRSIFEDASVANVNSNEEAIEWIKDHQEWLFTMLPTFQRAHNFWLQTIYQNSSVLISGVLGPAFYAAEEEGLSFYESTKPGAAHAIESAIRNGLDVAEDGHSLVEAVKEEHKNRLIYLEQNWIAETYEGLTEEQVNGPRRRLWELIARGLQHDDTVDIDEVEQLTRSIYGRSLYDMALIDGTLDQVAQTILRDLIDASYASVGVSPSFVTPEVIGGEFTAFKREKQPSDAEISKMSTQQIGKLIAQQRLELKKEKLRAARAAGRFTTFISEKKNLNALTKAQEFEKLKKSQEEEEEEEKKYPTVTPSPQEEKGTQMVLVDEQQFFDETAIVSLQQEQYKAITNRYKQEFAGIEEVSRGAYFQIRGRLTAFTRKLHGEDVEQLVNSFRDKGIDIDLETLDDEIHTWLTETEINALKISSDVDAETRNAQLIFEIITGARDRQAYIDALEKERSLRVGEAQEWRYIYFAMAMVFLLGTVFTFFRPFVGVESSATYVFESIWEWMSTGKEALVPEPMSDIPDFFSIGEMCKKAVDIDAASAVTPTFTVPEMFASGFGYLSDNTQRFVRSISDSGIPIVSQISQTVETAGTLVTGTAKATAMFQRSLRLSVDFTEGLLADPSQVALIWANYAGSTYASRAGIIAAEGFMGYSIWAISDLVSTYLSADLGAEWDKGSALYVADRRMGPRIRKHFKRLAITGVILGSVAFYRIGASLLIAGSLLPISLQGVSVVGAPLLYWLLGKKVTAFKSSEELAKIEVMALEAVKEKEAQDTMQLLRLEKAAGEGEVEKSVQRLKDLINSQRKERAEKSQMLTDARREELEKAALAIKFVQEARKSGYTIPPNALGQIFSELTGKNLLTQAPPTKEMPLLEQQKPTEETEEEKEKREQSVKARRAAARKARKAKRISELKKELAEEKQFQAEQKSQQLQETGVVEILDEDE